MPKMNIREDDIANIISYFSPEVGPGSFQLFSRHATRLNDIQQLEHPWEVVIERVLLVVLSNSEKHQVNLKTKQKK